MFPSNQRARYRFARCFLPILAALVWLMIPITMQAAIPQRERDALIAFYNGTSGAKWDLGQTWLGPVGSECGWSGVTCDSAQSTVLELKVTLAGGYSSVSFPPELGDLTNLQVLSIAGSEPSGIGVHIKDDGGFRTELLPKEIGNLKNLQELTLSQVHAYGGLPAEIGNLTNLTKLHITLCADFTWKIVKIPGEIGNLTKLQELVISNCRPLSLLSGSIPAALGNLTELIILNLSGNSLGGSIPPELGNLTKLQQLDLSHNFDGVGGGGFGPIPAELGNLTKLQYLNMSNNRLTSPIPAELGNLKELIILDMSHNGLSGAIPPALGNLTKLQQLDLSYSIQGPAGGLSGPIPAELGNLMELTYLSLGGNNLVGYIPPTLGNLTKLQQLYLGGNQLSGPIPTELGNLTSLQNLDLQSNQLSGPVPAGLGNLKELIFLYLSGNKLSAIPPALGNMTKLQKLYLQGNQLSGPIPAELGNLKELIFLYLSDNKLSAIPPALGNLTKLQKLYLDHNQLSGPIPVELGNLKELIFLDLSGNKLSAIPPALGNLSKLQTLYLQYNQLSGPIPAEFSKLTAMITLSLSGNNLVGSIQPALSILTGIISVDLSYNGLYAGGDSLKAFLDAHATWGNQTVAPGSVSAQPESSSSLLVQWAPIAFTAYGGRYEVWASAASSGPYILAGATADKLASSLRILGLSAGLTYYLVVRTVSDPNSYNQNTVTSDFSAEIFIAMPVAAMDLMLNAGGAATAATIGSTGVLETGYARVDMNSGNAFYGIAVYSYRPAGIVVSECGVPASPPTTSARIFVDYRTGATIPGSIGKVNVDTGLALVNRGAGPALITFTLRNLNGQVLSMGTGNLAQDAHIAKYLWELPAMVTGFTIPATFATDTRYGTLEIGSDQPLSVVALRLTTNQRGEMLMTSTPVADLARPLSTAPIYFAEFIDGGGYTTTLMLLNTSSVMMTGMLRIYANDGTALAVQQVGGAAGSAFVYSIVPGGAYVLQTDAAPVNFNVGWAELIPDQGTPTPTGAGLYQSSQDGVLAAESGIAAAIPTTHARVFVDTAGGHNSSVALANPGTAIASIAFAALGMDGSTATGTSVGPMMLNGKGHAAQFVWERISGLPAEFRGVLDIVSATPFVPLTIRALVNERGNFLFTAFPVADLNQAAPSPIVFPQIAAGGGTTTEIIMLSASTSGAATLRYFGNAGTPLAIGK